MKKKETEKQLLEVNLFWSPVAKRRPFQGEVWAVSSQNQVGKFDILPGHINFITLISDNMTLHLPNQRRVGYKFNRGVLEVSKNKVNVFLGL